MSKAIGRWQLMATWLLCAFLMAAYLDKLPDPPAVGPHGNEAKAAYLIDHREGSLNPGYRWARSLVPSLVVVRWLDSGIVFAAAHFVPCATQMRQASDSSPPGRAR
jgi:hypothetical protein